MQREQSSIFIWDWAFVEDRLAMPWGWISLTTAFIEQFFYHTAVGAFAIAILCLLVQQIAYRLLRLAGTSKWLFLFSFIPAIIVGGLPLHPTGGTEEEMKYDYLLRQGKWTQILKEYKKKEPQSQACQNAIRLALYQTGQMDQQTLFYGVAASKPLTGRTSAFIMSEVYLHMGLVAMSQRSAFEAMETIEDFNKSGRALQRLAITGIVSRQTEVSRKYLLLLMKTLSYRHWAQQYISLTEHPERITDYPSLHRLQQSMDATTDSFFH